MNGGGEGRRGDEEGETPVLWGLGVLAVILCVMNRLGEEWDPVGVVPITSTAN